MSFLARSVTLLAPAALLALAACSSPADDGSSASEANLDQRGKTTQPAPIKDTPPADGPLTADAAYGTAGTLQLAGASSIAIAAGRRADGSLGVLRNVDGNAALTIVAPDGSAQTDTALVPMNALQFARVHTHGDGLLVVGQIPMPDNGARYFVSRVGADGAVDASFTPDPLDLRPVDSAVTKDGKLLVTGVFSGHAAMVRLDAHGMLDATFADHGLWLGTDAAQAAGRIAIAGDGSIYVVTEAPDALSLLHFSADGRADAKFGASGVAALPAGGAPTLSLGLAATGKGISFVGPLADAEDTKYHLFSIDAAGKVTQGAAVDGAVITPAYGNFVSAVIDGDKCTLHVTEKATTDLTADECSLTPSYVGLGDGKRAVIFNTVTDGVPVTSIRVFGN